MSIDLTRLGADSKDQGRFMKETLLGFLMLEVALARNNVSLDLWSRGFDRIELLLMSIDITSQNLI